MSLVGKIRLLMSLEAWHVPSFRWPQATLGPNDNWLDSGVKYDVSLFFQH